MIREDILRKELELRKERNGLDFEKLKLSAKFIDWLFNNYYLVEQSEEFYDSGPHFDEEVFHMYMDYEYKRDDIRFSKEEHTEEELERAYNHVIQQCKDYEETRLTRLNWYDVYNVNWGFSQEELDASARRWLKDLKRNGHGRSYNGRLFYAQKGDCIDIYYFGRDYCTMDWTWSFKRKKIEPKRGHYKNDLSGFYLTLGDVMAKCEANFP